MIARQISSGLWAISHPKYSEALRSTAKSVPGMRWENVSRAWVGYGDAAAMTVSKLAEQNVEVVGGEDIVPEPLIIQLHRSVEEDLRDYQKDAVAFAIKNASSGVLIADDMGLGKTATAIRTVKALRSPSIVICPSFVRMVWRREVEKWRPKAHVFELQGVKPKEERIMELAAAVEKFGTRLVVLVHYDVVHAWVDILKQKVVAQSDFTTAVFDEIHYLQSDKSRRSVSCRALAAACTYRIGLSGTPMTSRPRDLWNPIETLSPGRFGRPFDFYIAHAAAHQETITMRTGPKTIWDTKGSSRLEELRERLSWFMIRRTKSEVALELPPRTRQVIEIEVTRTHQRNMSFAVGSDRAMREALAVAADGKFPKVLELALSHVEGGSKVVVFSFRRALADAMTASLVAEGVNAKTITGTVGHREREMVVDARPDVLCCTMDSTAVGIDLSYADVAVFIELDWVPSKLLQAEARLHRFGQEKPVLIQYAIALSTVDEIIRDAVLAKLETFAEAIGETDDELRKDLGAAGVDHLKRLEAHLMGMVERGEI